jgi:hypothetical protein
MNGPFRFGDLPVVRDRVPFPGYRTLVASTHNWRPPAPEAFVWVVYGPPDVHGFSDRACGFAPTPEAAVAAAS